MASRTMKLTHKGMTILVRESFDDHLEFVFNDGRDIDVTAKTFEAATNEARKWLLVNAGKMRSKYERGTT